MVTERSERRLVIQASNLPPLPRRNGQLEVYEVWLYNSRGGAVSVGAQYTDRQGTFQGAGPVPSNYEKSLRRLI